MGNRFIGIIPPVTTPFSETGDILWSALERNVGRYLETRVSGLLLLGSNGESVHLTETEKVDLLKRISSGIPSGRTVLVGAGYPALSACVRFLENIATLPVEAVLVSVPSYYKNRMTRRALEAYFLAVAERSPFPVLLYNVPQYTGLELSPDLIEVLSQHPNIVGMKDSSANLTYLQAILGVAGGQDFQVLLGSAQAFGPSLVLGIEAAILAVACAFPELPIRMLDHYRRGHLQVQEQLLLCRVGNAVTSRYGIPGLKYAMDLAGWEGKSCRPPLMPLTEAEKADLKRVVESARTVLNESFQAPGFLARLEGER